MKTIMKKVAAFLAVFAILMVAGLIVTHDCVNAASYCKDGAIAKAMKYEMIYEHGNREIISTPVIVDGEVHYRVMDENGHEWSVWLTM